MTIPSVTIDQMREVDRLMVEEFGVSILMMMENASRSIAIMSRQILGGSVKDKNILILSGKGNNGGDGLGATRHLTNFGAHVECVLAEPAHTLGANAQKQFKILQKSKISVSDFYIDLSQRVVIENTIQCAGISTMELDILLKQSDLIIDALLGYNLKGDPHDSYATLINRANQSKKKILAIDIPSGLNGDTGEASDPTIKANTTLTLALPKIGLINKSVNKYVGDLYLTDLSVPEQVYEKIGIDVPVMFERDEIIKM